MKQQFAQMIIGTEFVLDADANGEFGDLLAYKLSDSEAYCLGMGATHAGRIGTQKCYGEYIDLAADYDLTGKTLDVHATYTDLERVALALADKCAARHPALTMWAEAVKNDPNELRGLTEWAFQNADLAANDKMTLAQICAHYGYKFPAHKYDRDCNLFCLIWDGTPEGEYTRGEPTKQYRADGGHFDAPLAALLGDVVEYREMGRVSGDHSHGIMGLGAPLLTVTTSLAASIVEYVSRMTSLRARD